MYLKTLDEQNCCLETYMLLESQAKLNYLPSSCDNELDFSDEAGNNRIIQQMNTSSGLMMSVVCRNILQVMVA